MDYVVGHTEVDIDSYLSTILLEKVLRKLGLQVKGVLHKEVPKEVERQITQIRATGVIIPELPVKQDRAGSYYLVDHNDVAESGIQEFQVQGVIDHHPSKREKNKAESFGIYKIDTDLGSTTLVIYEEFKTQVDFSKEDKQLVLIGVLLDTLGLRFRATKRTKQNAQQLITELGLTKEALKLYNRLGYTEEAGVSEEEYMRGSTKQYDFEGIKVSTSAVMYYEEKVGRVESCERWLRGIEEENYLLVLIEGLHTYAYVKSGSEVTLLNHYPAVVSRGLEIKPAAAKWFKQSSKN